jgi:DNA-binding MarR family transcriptional regulator
MDNEILIAEVFETFDSINIEFLFEKLKLSLKGENMLMSILNSLGGQGTVAEINQYFDFTPARLSAIVKTLEAKGLVQKVQNKKDRRSFTIVLTSEGVMHYMRYRERAIANAMFLVEYLGEEDVTDFLRIVKKISDISNEITDK